MKFKNFKSTKPIEYTEEKINEIEAKAVNCANALAYWKGDIDHTGLSCLIKKALRTVSFNFKQKGKRYY